MHLLSLSAHRLNEHSEVKPHQQLKIGCLATSYFVFKLHTLGLFVIARALRLVAISCLRGLKEIPTVTTLTRNDEVLLQTSSG